MRARWSGVAFFACDWAAYRDAESGATRLWIENAGNPIAESQMPRLVDRFYGADVARVGAIQRTRPVDCAHRHDAAWRTKHLI